jgi:DNA primase
MATADEVRDRADIVEVVGDYVELKRSGRTYKGLCPFHSERTPSFVVYPDSGNWHCFGACSDGGDVFSFVMRIENVDFRGALEILARRYGVPLEPPTPQAIARKEKRERLLDAVAAAAELFHAQLMRAPSGEAARTYLRDRGFGSKAALAFGLGWAPDEWTATRDALRADGFSDEELLAAGLVRSRESGGVYDAYRGRLMFPIRDARGRPVGFGARTLEPDGVPKYINTPQTELFDKSHALYGIERAARSIRESGLAVVVEGYTDVVRAHVGGFENVVASLGTAITEAQLSLLKRYAKVLVLALDADAAGQAATLRGLEVAREAVGGDAELTLSLRGYVRWTRRADVKLRVATLPQGMDPDDVIRDDPEMWASLIEGAQPVLDYLFDALTADLDLSHPEGRTTAAERLLPVISDVPDAVARATWISRLSALVLIDERTLANQLVQPRTARGFRRRSSPGGRAAGMPASGVASSPSLAKDGLPGYVDAPVGESGAAPIDESSPPVSGQRQSRPHLTDALVSTLLGHLVLSPKRLRVLNAALEADGLRPLEGRDFTRALDRDVLEGVRYASHGAPPPDLPPEHRLDEPAPHMADYVAALRSGATDERPVPEADRIAALREVVLRMRRRDLRTELEGLKHMLRDTPAHEQLDTLARVREVSDELLRLERLLQPEGERRGGKLDAALRG